MSLSEILFIMWINTVPLGIIGMGCFAFYLFIIYEHDRLDDENR